MKTKKSLPVKKGLQSNKKISPGLVLVTLKKFNYSKIFLALVIALFSFIAPVKADYTVASGSSINANTITGQSGVLTVNGTLYVDQNTVSLLNFTSVVINGPNGQIYWNGNYDLKFPAGIQGNAAGKKCR